MSGPMRTPCPFGSTQCGNAECRDGTKVWEQRPMHSVDYCRACVVVSDIKGELHELRRELYERTEAP